MTQDGQITRTAFAQVPIQLLEQCSDRSLRGCLFVYLWLWHYAGIKDQAFPSVPRLAAECHMKPDDVRKALKWLAVQGWIKRIDRPGQTTLFHVRTEKEPRRTPPLKRVPLPRKGDTPKGVTLPAEPLPRKGDTPPPPEGGANKNHLTREEIKQEETPLPPTSLFELELPAEPSPKPEAKEPKDPFAARKLRRSLIPADLLDCQELLPEFWLHKSGVRSQTVFNRVCNTLRQLTPEDRRASLEAAINSGWGDVFPRKAALGLPNGSSSRRTSTQTTHDAGIRVGEFLRAHGLG
jgi:hypothetical protein